jgi:hypothetical protein
MEGAAPFLVVALTIPLLVGTVGFMLLRTRRWLGLLLLGATTALCGLMACFVLG